ncbi:MAG: hypothetical protein WC822_07005 [Candidatus Paceibacterota bacterium]
MNIPFLHTAVDFSATGSIDVMEIPAQAIPTKYAIQVTGYDAAGVVAAAGAWDVLLIPSIDGAVFDEASKIVEHVNTAQNNGAVVSSGGSFYPARFWQIKCKALTLGGAAKITVHVLAVK